MWFILLQVSIFYHIRKPCFHYGDRAKRAVILLTKLIYMQLIFQKKPYL